MLVPVILYVKDGELYIFHKKWQSIAAESYQSANVMLMFHLPLN